MYGRPDINISATSGLIKSAAAGNAKSAEFIRIQLAQLNAAAEDFDKTMLARTYVDDTGDEAIGGIVTERYVPITHVRLVDMMLATVGLDDAMVVSSSVTESRLDATIMLGDDAWAVDGGVKRGIFIKNGQFGDYSYGYSAMLFRLLCTNGMKDVIADERVLKRHLGSESDLAADIVAAMGRSDHMFTASQTAMITQVDVVDSLVELHRHRLLSRGALKKTLDRAEEAFGGVVVNGALTTLWGLSQSITAAARDYSFGQMNKLGGLAGRLVFEGLGPVLASNPLLPGAPSAIAVREEFVVAA
jgi:hypothetical protein